MPLPLYFTVPCPKCHAPTGEPCLTCSGGKMAVGYPHINRVRAFGLKSQNLHLRRDRPALKPHSVNQHDFCQSASRS
jgi:hypothetical protein